jgi:transcriptional regulator with XRE-family HTH domain
VTSPTLGHMLRDYRTAHNLLQVELGDRLGVRQSTVNRWLRDESVPSSEYYRVIRRLLRIDGPAFDATLAASNRRPTSDGRRRRAWTGWGATNGAPTRQLILALAELALCRSRGLPGAHHQTDRKRTGRINCVGRVS